LVAARAAALLVTRLAAALFEAALVAARAAAFLVTRLAAAELAAAFMAACAAAFFVISRPVSAERATTLPDAAAATLRRSDTLTDGETMRDVFALLLSRLAISPS
jgi:hypothetical protein